MARRPTRSGSQPPMSGESSHTGEPVAPYSDKLRVIHTAIQNRRNVAVVGPHGIGKTQAIRSIAQSMPGITLRYLSLAQMSADDILAPFPEERHGRRWVTYLPHSMFDDTGPDGVHRPILLVMDEFNRARDPALYNALLEFMSVGTIAGVPLNMHCFVALMNPSDEQTYFNTAQLEDSVLDRFDLFVEVDQYDLGADVYLLSRYPLAGAVIEWYLSLPDRLKRLVPPRRQEKLLQNLELGIPVEYSFPRTTELPIQHLKQILDGGRAWTLRAVLEHPDEAAEALKQHPRLLPMFVAFAKVVDRMEDAHRLAPLVLTFPSYVLKHLLWYRPTLWGLVLHQYDRQKENSTP